MPFHSAPIPLSFGKKKVRKENREKRCFSYWVWSGAFCFVIGLQWGGEEIYVRKQFHDDVIGSDIVFFWIHCRV